MEKKRCGSIERLYFINECFRLPEPTILKDRQKRYRVNEKTMDAVVTDQQEIILTDMKPNIEDIYSDVRGNMATLILGPDFLTSGGKPAKESLHEHLKTIPNNGILHFYPANGIFLFDSPNSKFNCQKAAARFYEGIEPDKEMLEKIMDLPFSLVLNTNPDKNLVKLFSEKKKPFQFDYFSRRPNKNRKEIEEPNAENPLIYNMFGSVEEFQSLVLDFEDMFNHLATLFNNTNVPDEIRTILKNTYTFIFLGFHLEKWDTQLLFRYINMSEQEFDNRKKNYTKKPDLYDDVSESFFTKQLNIRYYLAPVDFLQNIHTTYRHNLEEEENEKLKGMHVYDAINYLIDLEKFEKALPIIKENKEDLSDTETAILKGQYARYINIKHAGTTSKEEINILCNKLKYYIKEIIDVTSPTRQHHTLDGMSLQDAIYYFIGIDDLEGAINKLSGHIADDQKVEYFTIKGQYSSYTNMKLAGTSSLEDLELIRNKIRQAVFSICDSIKAP